MMRHSVILVAMLVATRATAQEPLAIAGADRETLAQLNQIVTSTSERGLPVDAVIGEARFAALFRADGPRIVSAARDFAAWMAQAREALAPNPTAVEIEAGAQALKNGVPSTTLTKIRQARRPRPVAVHLGLLIQLVQAKVEMATAERTILDLIRRNASNELLASLGNDFTNAVRLGSAPDDAFKKLNAVLAPGGSASALQADFATPGTGTSATTPPTRKKP